MGKPLFSLAALLLGSVTSLSSAGAGQPPEPRYVSAFRTTRTGVWLGPTVEEKARPHRAVMGEVTWRDGHPVRYSRVNGAGIAIEQPEGEATWVFDWRDDGTLAGYATFDRDGQPIARYLRDADALRRVDDTGRPTHDARTGISVTRYGFDERGFVAWERFENEIGDPRANRYQRYGIRYQRDKNGWPVVEEFLGPDGELAPALNGAVRARIKRDGAGAELEVRFEDASGAPAEGWDSWSRVATSVDKWERTVEARYFDRAGKPTIGKEGYARAAYRFDDRGVVVERRFFGPDGAPTIGKQGCAIERDTLDPTARVTETACFDASDRPSPSYAGIARERITRDEHGRRVKFELFDEKGARIAGREGWSIGRRRYDDAGRIVEYSNFDDNDRPTRTNDGCSTTRVTFDAGGRETRRDCLDERGALGFARDGWSSRVKAYDDVGHLAETCNLDERGRRADVTDCSCLRTLHGDNRRQIDSTCEDRRGNPQARRAPFAKKHVELDRLGHMAAQHLLDGEGKLVKRQRCARQVYRRNEHDNPVDESCFDAEGKPVRLANAQYGTDAHAHHFTLDARDRITRVDDDDSPGEPPAHCPSRVITRSADEREMRVDCLDRTGKPAEFEVPPSLALVAPWSRANADDGRVPLLSYSQGSPALKGCTSYTFRFDDRTRLVERRCEAAAQSPARLVTSERFTYDAEWRLVDKTTEQPRAAAGPPPAPSLGLAVPIGVQLVKSTRSYKRDRVGRVLEVRDLGERPGNAPTCPTVAMARDERGYLVERRCEDAHGSPIADADGISITRYRRDAVGHRTEMAFFDAKGQRVPHAQGGFAIVRSRYDGTGVEIETTFFDAKEQPVEFRIRDLDEGNVRWAADPSGEDQAPPHLEPSRLATAAWEPPIPVAVARIVRITQGGSVRHALGLDATGHVVAGAHGIGNWTRDSHGIATRADDKSALPDDRRKQLEGIVGALEVGVEMARLREAKPALFEGRRGMLIVESAPATAIMVGDVLLSYDGAPCDDPDDTVEATGKGGETVKLVLIRKGERLELSAPSGPLEFRFEKF